MEEICKKIIAQQVGEFIRTEIEERNFCPGMKLPSDTEMAESFGVQKQTVQTAIDALEKEGLLKRISNKEIYVLGKKIERNMEHLEGFTQTMQDRNIVPSRKILSRYLREAGNKYGSMFGIDPKDPIFYIKRVCCANEEPVSLEEIYIPHYLIPKIEGMDLSVFSVYEIYGMYGIKLMSAEQTLDLVRPNMRDSKVLGIEPGTACMLFQSVTHDTKGRVVEFNHNYVRGDKCIFSVHFS